MGENQRHKLAALLILFGLSLLSLGALCLGVTIDASFQLLTSSSLLVAITSLVFWLASVWFSQKSDTDSVCWESLHQGLVAWKQAMGEQKEDKAKSLYEQGKGAVSFAMEIEPTCVQLRQALERMSSPVSSGEGDWRLELSFRLGTLYALNPFAVPSVQLAIWVQTMWQVWVIIASVLSAIVGWSAVEHLHLRSLIYAASGGSFGASIYNLRTLADHIAVQRDYSARFWVDYFTRPIIGCVLGVVVYAFAVGLAWTLTLQSPSGSQMPKVIFALGFLSGYSLRSVLTWLNGVAKTIFRPAPSPGQE